MSTDRSSVADLEGAGLLSSLLSSTTKLAILIELSCRPMTVGDLCRSLDLSQSLVSHHLSGLRSRKLVHSLRRKQTQVYSMGAAMRVEQRPIGMSFEVLDKDGTVRVAVSIAGRVATPNGTIHLSGLGAGFMAPRV